MVNSFVILLDTFALAVFLLLNGPLWLSSRLRIFTHGPQSPQWLVLTIRIVSRTLGIVGILLWLITAGQGNILDTVWLGVILICGAFLLLGGPLWLVTRTTIFARGPEASVRLLVSFSWLCRIVGAVAVVSVLFLAFWLQLLGSQ